VVSWSCGASASGRGARGRLDVTGELLQRMVVLTRRSRSLLKNLRYDLVFILIPLRALQETIGNGHVTICQSIKDSRAATSDDHPTGEPQPGLLQEALSLSHGPDEEILGRERHCTGVLLHGEPQGLRLRMGTDRKRLLQELPPCQQPNRQDIRLQAGLLAHADSAGSPSRMSQLPVWAKWTPGKLLAS
jgi:hypothetical protein